MKSTCSWKAIDEKHPNVNFGKGQISRDRLKIIFKWFLIYTESLFIDI